MNFLLRLLHPVVLFATASSAMPPTDRQIEAAVQASYTFHTILQDRISATSRDGTLTLMGVVLEEEDRALAVDTAVSIRGVLGIENLMRVESSIHHGTDARIAHRLLRRIQGQAGLSLTGASITVADGIVTLTGTTPDSGQSERMEHLAYEISQVRAVRNCLTLGTEPISTAPGAETMDDASITAQVNLALHSNGMTAGLNAQGIVHNGVVTLIGGPGTSLQKNSATRLIEGVRGVRSVLNRIVPF